MGLTFFVQAATRAALLLLLALEPGMPGLAGKAVVGVAQTGVRPTSVMLLAVLARRLLSVMREKRLMGRSVAMSMRGRRL